MFFLSLPCLALPCFPFISPALLIYRQQILTSTFLLKVCEMLAFSCKSSLLSFLFSFYFREKPSFKTKAQKAKLRFQGTQKPVSYFQAIYWFFKL